VNVSLQGGIRTIESPTHQVVVSEKDVISEKPSWTRALVQLVGDTTDMDRDFILLITPEEIHKPRVYIEVGRSLYLTNFQSLNYYIQIIFEQTHANFVNHTVISYAEN
jgi:hypothetical protein